MNPAPADLEPDDGVIKINSFENLIKIGRFDDYPANGHYQLNCNLIANGTHEHINNFSGILDGKGNCISQQQNCLINNLIGTGVIKNIIFSDADIHDASCSSIVVKHVSGSGLISSISVENCQASSSGVRASIGLVAHTLTNNARIEYVNAKNNYVRTTGKQGHGTILAFKMSGHSQCINNTVHNCNVKTEGYDSCSSIIGRMSDDTKCTDNIMTNCSIKVYKTQGQAAIFTISIEGRAKVINNKAINCMVSAKVAYSYSAIGSAISTSNSILSYNEFTNCTVISYSKRTATSMGVATQWGNSKNSNNIFNNCKVKSYGISNDSAISSG